MTSLEDTFGEEFAKNLQGKIAERREQRNRVTDEIKKEIANKAVNENALNDAIEEGEPHFQYKDENGVTHDVLLMQAPNPNSKPWFSMANELSSGAISIPMNYLGEFMSCLFNNPDEVKRMEEGEHYILIGKLDTWEPEDGEPRDQLQPVRGVMNMEEIQRLADDWMAENGPNEMADGQQVREEQAEAAAENEPQAPAGGQEASEAEPEAQEPPAEPEPQDEEPDESSSGGGLSGMAEEAQQEEADEEPEEEDTLDEEEEGPSKPRFGGRSKKAKQQEEEEPEPEPDEDEDEDELGFDEEESEDDDRGIAYADVSEKVEQLAAKEPRVWEVEEGDQRLNKLANVVAKRLDLNADDDAVMEEIRSLCLKRIEEERMEEEDEDEAEEDALF